MAKRFWRNLGGAVVNAAMPGSPYNQYTGQYGQQALRSGLISTAAGQLVPGGAAIAQAIQNRQPGMQAWNAGLSGWQGIDKQLDGYKVQTPRQGMQVPNMQMSGFPQMSAPQQSFGSMAPQGAETQPTTPWQPSAGIQVSNAVGPIGFSRAQLQPNLAGGGLANYMTSSAARDSRSSARHAARGGGTMGFAHAHRDHAMPQYRYGRE